MINRLRLSVLLCLIVLLPAFSQQKNALGKYVSKMSQATQKDDPAARVEFMRMKYRDPLSGEIPSKMRSKELSYYEANLLPNTSSSRIADNFTGWVNRGPYNVGGRTRALAVDVSNEDVILAGGVSGGMWRSTDGGQSWSKTSGSDDVQSVTAIAQDTREGHRDTWYYASGEYSGNSAAATGAYFSGTGVFKSVDGGQSWALIASTDDGNVTNFTCLDYIHELAVSPATGDVLVATYCGIHRSTDGGESWSLTLDNIDNGAWSDLVFVSDGTAYAYTSVQGVFKSTDGGGNWENISDDEFPDLSSNDRGELAVTDSNKDIVYLLMENSEHESGHGLWKYDNDDGVWEDRSDGIPQEGGLTGDFTSQGGYDLLIKVKPDDEDFVIIGGTNLYRSTDGFSSSSNTSWIGGYTPGNNSYALYTNHHPDQHTFVFYPSDPNQVISGNDGGLQFASDIRVTNSSLEPITWTPLNNGYLTTQVYAVSIGPDDQILAGFQDNGTWETMSTSSTVSWHSPFSGDGAYSAYSSNGAIRYMSSQQANIYRIMYEDANDTSPNNYVAITPNSGYSTNLFITPFYLDFENDEIFYLGGAEELWVNTQASSSTTTNGWKSIELGLDTDHVITEFGVVGNGTTYVGTSQGKVFKVESVEEASPIVTDVSPSETSGRYVSGIGVNEENPDELLVVVSNYNVKSIFYSTDGGESWSNIGGNLEDNEDGSGNGPSVRTARILGDGDVYLVGTSVGLFTTTSIDGATTQWIQEDIDNLGAVVVEHLVTRNDDKLVVVGTHGNGVYTTDSPILLEVDMAVVSINSPSSGILGEESVEVTVKNNGVNEVSSFSLTYSVNDVVQATETVNSTIASAETYLHTFASAFDFSAEGSYTIEVGLELENDEDLENNNVSVVIQSIRPNNDFPYEQGFESTDHEWTLNGFWEVGAPAQTILSEASEGSSALMTDLDANYPDDAYSSAVSPIFDFSGLLEPEVSFDLKADIEVDYDGVVFAYRTSLSDNFTIVTTGTANWYNGYFAALGTYGWTGSLGYVRAVADLSDLAGEQLVQFAFFLLSDETVNGEGIVIDQFEISEASTVGSLELTDNSVPENEAVGYVVGTLSMTSGVDASYELVSGNGDTNNELFTIDGSSLVTASVFNFEETSTLSIRVASNTSAGTVINNLMISVVDMNDTPTGISITNSELDENLESGVLVGMLIAEDEDSEDEYTFELVSGEGDSDNGRFGISGHDLISAVVFDYENQSNYSIRVKVSDLAGETVEEVVNIVILDVNEAPEGLELSNNTIAYDQVDGYEIGEFNAVDQEKDDIEFVLSDDPNSDNSSFAISGKILQTSGLDIESLDDVYTITVEAKDTKGAFTSKLFELSIAEILGLMDLAKTGVSVFPNPVADYLYVAFNNGYLGKVRMNIFSQEGKVVYRHLLDKSSGQTKERIDLTHLKTGIYIIQFEMGGKMAQGKLSIK